MRIRAKGSFTLLVGLMVVGLASMAAAQDVTGFSTTLGLPQGSCVDFVTGGGYIVSPTGSGKANFGFTAGYPFGAASSPTAVMVWKDKAAGLTMRVITVDRYVGYNCHNADSTACYDREFAGYAEVTLPNFSGVLPFLVEVIDNLGSAKRNDWVHMAVGNYVVIGEIISGGSIKVHKPSAEPNCQ